MKDDFGGNKLKVCRVFYYIQKIRVGWVHRETNETLNWTYFDIT